MMCHLCSRLKNILVRIECVITEGGRGSVSVPRAGQITKKDNLLPLAVIVVLVTNSDAHDLLVTVATSDNCLR